jgi:hypothetical protein
MGPFFQEDSPCESLFQELACRLRLDGNGEANLCHPLVPSGRCLDMQSENPRPKRHLLATT